MGDCDEEDNHWADKFLQKISVTVKINKRSYFPSCSQYGLEAVERFGVLKGGFLCIWRILRCNPFSQGGYDPVPSINSTANTTTNIRRKNIENEKKFKTYYKF